MDQNDVKLLITLGKELNLTTTAEKMFITQPALTYRLKALEKELGANLFVRKSTGLELTPAGTIAVSYANHFENEYEEMLERIASASGKKYFSLRIAASPAYIKYKLPLFLAQFAKKHADVDIYVESHKSTTCLNLLREKKVHLAIIRGDHLWNGGSVFLGSDAICLVADKPLALQNLPKLPYISYLTDEGLLKTISEWWQEYFNAPPRTVMHLNDSDACRAFVSQGLGYSIIPGSLGSSSKYKNLHVEPLYHVDGSLLVRTSWIKYYKSSTHIPVIKMFIDELVDFMKWQGAEPV